MLERLLAASIRHRLLVMALVVALIVAGARAFEALPIDAVPDLTNVQVQVLTAAPALGTLDVERLVTTPVEQALAGLPRLSELRSISRQGVSAVTVVFEDDVDPYFARQIVDERMLRARASVAAEYGAPEIGPMTSALGEVYQFEVRGAGRSLMELRAILDWQIAPRLRLVPGVVDVNTFGGELQTYEVALDPARMTVARVALQDVVTALERNNRATGGGSIVRGPEALLVRGDGLVRSVDEIADIVVATHEGVPVYVRQVAEVRLAPMLRVGAVSRDGRGEAVVGMAMMLVGENSRTVSRAIDEEVRRIDATLPRGVRIDTFYDRTMLVNRTIHTVARSLAEGGALVIVVLFLMLRNVRAGLIAAAMIPLCMLGAFVGMRATGLSGNLMSLGAIDFGLVVDGAIILLENAVHHMAEEAGAKGRTLDRAERDAVVLRSALEVRSATAFGEVIIALVYLPILALEGIEGRMFRPMALTVLFALATAFVLSLTFVPAVASLLLAGDTRDRPSFIVQSARRIYTPLLDLTLGAPKRTLLVAIAALVGAALLARGLGSEFAPTLDEGTLVIETTRLPSVSLEESVRQTGVMERTLRAFPEVLTVVSRTGRPEIANDPMGVEMSDVYVVLRPREQWTGSHDRADLSARMARALREALPGTVFGFSQPIQMRTNELVSGVRADVAVKVQGEDLQVLARLGARIERVLSHVRGAADVRADRLTGLPVLHASVDRVEIARRGSNADDVLAAIESVGGTTVGTVLEGPRRFPLRVRIASGDHTDVAVVRSLPVRVAGDAFAPLSDLARFETTDEPVVINHEGIERRLIVQANVRGRDLGGFADEAQAAVARDVHLPRGYRLEWGGQFENLRRARARLALVVPLGLALILALLYASFRDVRPALLIFTNVAFAATGGVAALALRGLPFSISAAVGFIALFGVAVLNGLVLITQVRRLHDDGLPVRDAAREGALRRLRPVLTTALVASLGFVPMAFAHGDGAEVQRPLASVVIGGLFSSTLLTLLVLPTIYAWVSSRGARTTPVPTD